MIQSSEDPWRSIAAPQNEGLLSMRRSSEVGPWDFYWARDIDRRCLLVLRADPSAMPATRLPRLKGLELLIQPAEHDGKSGFVLRLLDQSLKDIFLRLCLDVIDSSFGAISEADAVARALARTWRWHHLLRGGRGLLDPAEQMGLMGELRLLERFFIPHVKMADSISAWRGPLGEAQDFCSAGIAVECKARGRGTDARVRISSEQQLDCSQHSILFLALTAFEFCGIDQQSGLTVSDLAHRVRTQVLAADEHVVGRFDAMLESAGFSDNDDYSAWTWQEAGFTLFEVRSGFPGLVPAGLPAGVLNVQYDLSLPHCADFVVQSAVLEEALLQAHT